MTTTPFCTLQLCPLLASTTNDSDSVWIENLGLRGNSVGHGISGLRRYNGGR